MDKQTDRVDCPVSKTRWGFPIVALTVGSVLAGSDNRGVKAMGAGIAVAAALSLLNKLAAMVD
ncbi:hypothetical protein pEaSNUABM37_00145 [Erwinia phage pEa_SNUABM_37]|nr:hypothetical protein pEaSNUABM37_00145 [Erwinia phage pEa_SNUABM_37]QXO10615.1 hypothetical protein pEaSNUABM48_00145 [Erwinia phage pEa_SNUABM_48]